MLAAIVGIDWLWIGIAVLAGAVLVLVLDRIR